MDLTLYVMMLEMAVGHRRRWGLFGRRVQPEGVGSVQGRGWVGWGGLLDTRLQIRSCLYIPPRHWSQEESPHSPCTTSSMDTHRAHVQFLSATHLLSCPSEGTTKYKLRVIMYTTSTVLSCQTCSEHPHWYPMSPYATQSYSTSRSLVTQHLNYFPFLPLPQYLSHTNPRFPCLSPSLPCTPRM